MKKYILILFIGFTYWGCEDKKEKSLIGNWKSYDVSYDFSHSVPENNDSVTNIFKNGTYIYNFTDEKLTIYENGLEKEEYLYYKIADTLFINFVSEYFLPVNYNLSKKLTLSYPQQILTSSTGDELGTFTFIQVFKR